MMENLFAAAKCLVSRHHLGSTLFCHFTDCVRLWTEIQRRNEGKWVSLQQTNVHEKKKKKKSKLCLTVLGLIVEVFALL